MKTQKGITLIALIITIIVMLILVGVSVSVALNTGLFKTAQGAAKQTKNESEKEENISSGMISIGSSEVNIEEYVNTQLSMVEIYDSEFNQTSKKLTVKARILESVENVEYIEYGFIITTQKQMDKIEDKNLTLDTNIPKQVVVAYSKSEGTDIFYGKDGNYKIYRTQISGTPEEQYGSDIFVRVYVKCNYNGEERILYSNQFVTNITENINAGKVTNE